MKTRFLLAAALLSSLAAFASDCEKKFFFGGVPQLTRMLPDDICPSAVQLRASGRAK